MKKVSNPFLAQRSGAAIAFSIRPSFSNVSGLGLRGMMDVNTMWWSGMKFYRSLCTAARYVPVRVTLILITLTLTKIFFNFNSL